MKIRACIAFALLTATVPAFPQAKAAGEDSYLRNASRVFARQFSSGKISYILMDLRNSASIESNWFSTAEPIPIGSLVKPFTGLAYAESHKFVLPEETCAGGDACWNPRGHGKLNFVQAIAVSCNSYFTQLASQLSAVDVASVAGRYGLSGPPMATTPEGLAGRYGEWRESPRAIVHAYAELISRRTQPAVRDILLGMRESAKVGTALGASRSAKVSLMAKTGTAPCTHANHAPGDGFALLVWPSETPHYLLLVRAHSMPGAHAAVLAGKMVRSLEPSN